MNFRLNAFNRLSQWLLGYVFRRRRTVIIHAQMGFACDGSDIPTLDVDPYESLAFRNKLPYTYSFHTDFYGEQYMIREIPRNIFFTGPDPAYKPPEYCDWDVEEYEVGDKLHMDAIATPLSLSHRISTNLNGVDTFWVRCGGENSLKEELQKCLSVSADLQRTMKRKASDCVDPPERAMKRKASGCLDTPVSCKLRRGVQANVDG